MSERETGTVKWFDPQKGYGFIARDSGNDIFVHHSSVSEVSFEPLAEGDRVTFVVGEGRKGPAAQDVQRI